MQVSSVGRENDGNFCHYLCLSPVCMVRTAVTDRKKERETGVLTKFFIIRFPFLFDTTKKAERNPSS